MITNPSCQGSEGVKEEQGKFQGQTNPTFEEEVADMGGGPGQAPSGGTHTEVAGVKFAAKAGAIVLARFKSLVKAKIKRPCLKPYVGLLFQQCWESHRDGQLQREL